MRNTKHLLSSCLVFAFITCSSFAQQVNISGKVVNSNDSPVNHVLIYLLSDPNINCYSDPQGNFSLNNETTAIEDGPKEEKNIMFKDRKLLLSADNQLVSVNIYSLDGRMVLNIIRNMQFSGGIGLYPEAYLKELPPAIYIVQARVGNISKSFKIQNLGLSKLPKGITEEDIISITGFSSSETISKSKSDIADTLILLSDFYKERSYPIITYSANYDSIRLNNFAAYTPADEFKPAITHLYGRYRNFTDIYSADSIQFIIHYDTLSVLEDHLKIITIPVDGIEGLDNGISLIAGLHLEPAGLTFTQPVKVGVILKDTVPDDLVVFTHNEKGETYYIPYQKYLDDSCSVIFSINHFSDIGVGTGTIPPMPDPAQFTSSDQFISYLAQHSLIGEAYGVFFTLWYYNVVDPMIDGITNAGDLREAMNEFLVILRCLDLFGIEEGSFVGVAKTRLSYEAERIWGTMVNAYEIASNNCIKREIIKDALNLIKLIDLFPLTFNPSLNEFGDGEAWDLTTMITFPAQTKHLEIGENYTVEYSLICPSGNPLPENITWSSSKPSVATIDANGKIIAREEGKTVIKGKICDIENTFTVEVAGINCVLNYCSNPGFQCYTGTYKGSVTLPTYEAYPTSTCGHYRITEDISLLFDFTYSQVSYVSSQWEVEEALPAHIPDEDICYTVTTRISNPNGPWRPNGIITGALPGCVGLNEFTIELGGWDNSLILSGGFYGGVLILEIKKYVWWTDETIFSQIYCQRID